MARVTVEDCEKVVPNRFDLVILAAQRARQIIAGDKVTVDVSDEKKPVIALREIAAQTVSSEALQQAAVTGFRTFLPDDTEEEDIDEFDEDTYNPEADLNFLSGENSDLGMNDDAEEDIDSPDIELADEDIYAVDDMDDIDSALDVVTDEDPVSE
jgi:DNA-directed RNA polymerase subunit omega